MKLLDKYGINSLHYAQQKYIKEFNVFPDSLSKIEKLERRIAEIIEEDEDFRVSIFEYTKYPVTNVFRLYTYKLLVDDELKLKVRQYALFLGSQAVIDYITQIDGSYSFSMTGFVEQLNFIAIQNHANKNYDAIYNSIEIFERHKIEDIDLSRLKRYRRLSYMFTAKQEIEDEPELLCEYVKKHYKIEIEPAIVERLIQSPTRRINLVEDIKEHVRQAQVLQVADFNDFGL